MFYKITYLEDIEKLAGIFVKNGYTVNRAKVKSKSGKGYTQGIEVTGDGDVQETEDEDE